jgi:hypothetical protein
MATIQQEIMSIAEAQDYDGDAPSTIAQAVNALGSVIGGGGSGGAGVTFVDFTFNQSTGKYDASLTNKEICDLVDSGALVVGRWKSVSSGGSQTDCYYYRLDYAVFNTRSKTYDLNFVGMAATGTSSVSLHITAMQNASSAAGGTEWRFAYKDIS